jgi:D-alanyl-D-alanine carboxypeptidase
MQSRNRLLLGVVSIFIAFLVAAPAFGQGNGEKSRAKHKQTATKKLIKKHTEKKKKVKQPAKGIQAKAVYCVNLRGNQTLLERNADKALPIASLTKLVTALVTLDSMPLDKEVTVPDHIKKIPKTVVGLNPGDKLTVRDLLHGLLIGSANDCAETLACAYPGGRNNFVLAMNKKVRGMGTRHTRFYTPSGLDKKTETGEGDRQVEVDSNVSTAREIAGIARDAFSNSTIRSICRKKSHVMASCGDKTEYSVRTTNKLLRDNLPLIGGKTGYTARAGHCLATEFTPGSNILLIVVLGSPDHFRDTRLAYHKALEEANKTRISPAGPLQQRKLAAERIGN